MQRFAQLHISGGDIGLRFGQITRGTSNGTVLFDLSNAGTASSTSDASIPEARSISSRWPISPKPVTSVAARAPESSPDADDLPNVGSDCVPHVVLVT